MITSPVFKNGMTQALTMVEWAPHPWQVRSKGLQLLSLVVYVRTCQMAIYGYIEEHYLIKHVNEDECD